MAKQVVPLTDTKIEAAKNKDKPYKLYDGAGLILEIRALPSKKRYGVLNIHIRQARKMY
jgi:hypothetical protein